MIDYGDMTEEEIQICYRGNKYYKGFVCTYIGLGTLIFTNGKTDIKAYRGEDVKNWVEECWKECKQKIDDFEANRKEE